MFSHQIGSSSDARMKIALAKPTIFRGSSLLRSESRGPIALPAGRLVELCAGPTAAQSSIAAMVLRHAQAEGDPVAWVQPSDAGLFPPDLAAAGLDLDALVVVHVPAKDPSASTRAAELILRTGAFGALVIDLSCSIASLPRGSAWQGRLLGLAREHACRVIVLSPHGRARASLGALVSLRFDVRRARIAPGRFRVEANVLKDKSGLAPKTLTTTFEAPMGVR
jgi:recombination protein RecA